MKKQLNSMFAHLTFFHFFVYGLIFILRISLFFAPARSALCEMILEMPFTQAFPFAALRVGLSAVTSGASHLPPLLHYAFATQLLGDSLKTVHWTVFALLRSAVPYVPQRLMPPLLSLTYIRFAHYRLCYANPHKLFSCKYK